MIRVNKLISRPATVEGLTLAIGDISGVTVPVRDLERAVRFYSRVFGFRMLRNGRPQLRRSATMTGPGGALLALHEYDDTPARPVPIHRRWGFLVDELDRVREAIWDLGVRVADDNGEPDHIHRWSNGRSLCVHDADGNEIELVEECRKASGAEASVRCPARAAWRRWVRPDCAAAR